MPLRGRACLSVLCSVVLVLGALYWCLSALLLRGWRRIEDQNAAEDVRRVVDAIQNDADSLAGVVGDYSVWDDAYRFMADRNRAFIDSSLADTAFGTLKVNQIVLIDERRQVVFQRGLDIDHPGHLPLPPELAQLASSLPARPDRPDDPGVAGLVMLGEHAALVAAKPVLTSEGKGPRRGFVVMARYLNQVHLERLSKVTHLPFALTPLAGAPPEWQAVARQVSANRQPLVRTVNSQLVRAYDLEHDLHGVPALVVSVSLDRPVYEEAVRTLRMGGLLLLANGLGLALLMLVLLDRQVLNRIGRLRAAVRSLDFTAEGIPRISYRGHDELSEVADMVNEMVDELVRFRERSREAEEHAAQAKAGTLAAVSGFYLAFDGDGRLCEWTPATEAVLGVSLAEATGQQWRDLPIGWDTDTVAGAVDECRQDATRVTLEDLVIRKPSGDEVYLRLTAAVVPDPQHPMLVLLGEDVTEHFLLERQLAQAQKLESIGQLAAGIAHEINTPTQFVGDNVRYLSDVFGELSDLLTACSDLKLDGADEALERIREAAAQIDFDELLEDVPAALTETLEGVQRIAKIVLAMKEFSHPGEADQVPVDINHAIENTLTVARNEWKYVAEVACDLQPDLPEVMCQPGELNQVLLNLIVNAAHAIGERYRGSNAKGTITLATRQDGEWVEVRIADTGTGIPESVRERIFDPFFTTKEVGKGTGQGLAIARAVITDKHHGQLTFETIMGEGTTFIIRLPLGLAGIGGTD